MKHLLFGIMLCCLVMMAVEPGDVAGRQVELCMIGDSITWANNGDWFRKHLLEFMPELAFVGTHTARFGYSHAGEGGNRTGNVLKRIDDLTNIPNSRYYHLLIGVNDSASGNTDEKVPVVSRGTADRIMQIVEKLLSRPATELVFLGTIMPCSSDARDKAKPEDVQKFLFRDKTASATNALLRKDVPARFGAKVVLIEYENRLRARDDWKEIIHLHPSPEGYKVVAAIAAEYLKKYTKPDNKPLSSFGVEVTNLWNAETKRTAPLIAGWYVVSFDVKKADGDKLKFKLASCNPDKLRAPLKMDFSLPAKAGQRVQFMFMTGYEGYKYNQSSIEITDMNGEVENVMVEKMRPSLKASVYGKGVFVDYVSPMALGEKFVK